MASCNLERNSVNDTTTRCCSCGASTGRIPDALCCFGRTSGDGDALDGCCLEFDRELRGMSSVIVKNKEPVCFSRFYKKKIKGMYPGVYKFELINNCYAYCIVFSLQYSLF